MGATLSVDTSRWPLVLLTHAGAPDLAQMQEHLREIEETVLARGSRFVQIIDQRQAELPAGQRAEIAEHQRRMDEAYKRNCLGEAYVVSARNRGAMVAVFWQAQPPYPYVLVDTMEEALTWAVRRAVRRPAV
jgi:hypothetical protein